MKKFIMIAFIVAFVVLCTGCDGNVTRDIRHAGFSVGSKFECAKIYAKDNNGGFSTKVRYFLGDYLIDEDGEIYEVSLSQKYSNGENCMKAKTTVHVDAIFDNRIIKGTDGKYYYLGGQSNLPNYSAVPTTDNSYTIYDILLKDKDVVKAMTADNSSGLYYVLKTDGNVYGYTISTQNRNTPARLTGTRIIYSKDDYGNIVDFNYAGNSLTTFVKSETQLYRMKITNSKDCGEFRDVECKFVMQEDSMYEKHASRIVVYNGSTLITDYKTIFTVTS